MDSEIILQTFLKDIKNNNLCFFLFILIMRSSFFRVITHQFIYEIALNQ